MCLTSQATHQRKELGVTLGYFLHVLYIGYLLSPVPPVGQGEEVDDISE